MKIRHILGIATSVAALTAMVGGCSKDYLDVPVQNAISSDILASSESGVQASLISTYKMLNGFTNTVGNTWGSAPSNYIFNSASDDVHKGSEPSDNPDGYYEVSRYQWSPGLLVFTHKFQAMYEGIRRANNTIQLAVKYRDEKSGSATAVASIIAQAKFLRAWYHFEAYKMWKNVPYYDETDVDFTKPNTEDIMPKLIADLDAAFTDLPADKTQVGRVDKTVALAFRGKLKLYKKDYTGAKADFDAVVTSGKYVLAACYNDVFTISKQNGKESIFSEQASINDGDGNATNSNFLERLAAPHTGSVSGCCGFNNPTQDLANAYQVDAGGLPVGAFAEPVAGVANPWNATRTTIGISTTVDPRIDWSMGRTGVPYLDWGNHSDGWIRGAGWAGLYSPKKNMKLKTDPEGPGWTTGQLHSKNVELIRYADVLLMLAEAEVEAGTLARATQLVNMVRTRAAGCAQGTNGATGVALNDVSITWATYKVSPYPTDFPDKASAQAAVRRERRLELATEGHRIFDLRRWGILEATITNYRAYESTVTNVVAGQTVRVADLDGAIPVSAIHYMFPLPNTEVDLSNGNLKQNTGF